MEVQTGELEIDEARLREADPDGLYLFMLEDYPYMMTPDHVAAFTGTTSQEIRKLLCRRGHAGLPHRYPLVHPEAGLAKLPLQGSPREGRRHLCSY